ncbi:MAG: four helix bundle protein [Bacilli bacterium]
MLQVSRDNNLKIPKKIVCKAEQINTVSDIVAIKEADAITKHEVFKKDKIKQEVEKDNVELDKIFRIPFNANDLVVITVVKKLGAYVIAVTEKSPKRFRGVFVNRMQNFCLDALEDLLKANYIRMDCLENKTKRENLQKEAIVKLKLLGYVAMLAENSGCILKKQYKQISLQLAEAINLIVAWKKSDDERWKNTKKGF